MGCDFSGLRNRFAKAYKQKAIDVQTNMLLDYAPKELKRAYEGKTFKNDTMNLADSYVWVVYYNGIVKGSGYLWAGRTAGTDSSYHGGKVNGRELAQTFIDTYTPNGGNGWELVFAATAPYSTYLESGANGRKFFVLTSIFDEINIDFKGKAKLSKIISY
ncbi:MAG: hypothetical protein WCS17_09690 [Prevotella sp.]